MKFLTSMNCWRLSLLSVVLWLSFANASQVEEEDVLATNDSDGDRIVDTIDVDDDNDGIPDIEEISGVGQDIDSDRDGIPNRLDLDSDNDGILDWKESGAVMQVDFSAMRVVSGRILGGVGTNGFIDDLETSIDNGQKRYTLVNTDWPADELPDVLDLDSDNDGLTDLLEAGVDASNDIDNDARIDFDGDTENGGVGSDGIPDRLQTSNDKTCCDVNGDGIEDIVPRNTDKGDLPDFQDLDSDNDGATDLIEAGGTDLDGDGRIDNFFDSPVFDGMDDAILLIPFESPDSNGNGVPDFIDEFAQIGAVSTQTQPANTEPTPVPDAGLPADDESVDGQAGVQVDGQTDEPINEQTVDISADTDPETTIIRDPAQRPGGYILPDSTLQPAEDDPSSGLVNTGLNGAGCSVQSNGIDLIVLLLSVFSVALLGWRYTIRRVQP